MRMLSALAVTSLMLTTVLTGCRITTHKNGDNDNVDIGTPFGSMQVKTNDNVNTSALGITAYPGAQIVKKDKDNGAADVNMNFGSFHLTVTAVGYTTPDSTDKVLAFYQKDLGRYGDVLHCEGKHPIGEPTRTAEGLTCDSDASANGDMTWNTDSGEKNNTAKTELRAGSKQHQHIVVIDTKDGGTKIGLVALELPAGDLHGHHKDGE